MIKVLIEVGSGPARFSVAVRAKSIQRAVNVAETRYPGGDVRVVFPIDPAAFLAESPAAEAGLIELEIPERAAG